MDQGKDYWLLRALELRPGRLETLIAYAQYLQLRWGGSYEDIHGLASGPQCETLTKPQRNAILWTGASDELSDLPQPEETQAVQAHRQAFESFLQRALRSQERGEALGRFANFISYSLGDHMGARQLHTQSVAAYPGICISARWTRRSAVLRT